MGRKIILFSSIILLCGGYFAFWNSQEKKVISMIEAISNKSDAIRISYDKISKKKNLFKLGVEIANLRIEYHDVQSIGVADSPMKGMAYAIFDKVHFESDVFLKHFIVKNVDKIKYKSEKGSGSIKYDFDLKADFAENPLHKKFISKKSNLDNLQLIDFANDGYVVYDEKNEISRQSSKKSKILIKNLSDTQDYIYSLFLSAKDADVEKMTDDFSEANGEIDVDFKKSKVFTQKLDLNLKNISLMMKNSSLSSKGTVTLGVFDMSRIGELELNLENYQFFLNSIREFIIKHELDKDGESEKYIDFIEKIIPEIGEKKSETLYTIACVFDKDRTLIGKKTFEELSKEFQLFISQNGGDSGQKNLEQNQSDDSATAHN